VGGAEAGGDEPTVVLPASRLFSRSSFVAVERSMTTWPEQILWTEAESICLIVPVISSTQMHPQLVHLSRTQEVS
jgi:hypothetical protein